MRFALVYGNFGCKVPEKGLYMIWSRVFFVMINPDVSADVIEGSYELELFASNCYAVLKRCKIY